MTKVTYMTRATSTLAVLVLTVAAWISYGGDLTVDGNLAVTSNLTVNGIITGNGAGLTNLNGYATTSHANNMATKTNWANVVVDGNSPFAKKSDYNVFTSSNQFVGNVIFGADLLMGTNCVSGRRFGHNAGIAANMNGGIPVGGLAHAFGGYAGANATGMHWNAFGNYAGNGATGNYWYALGEYSGRAASGDRWYAIGKNSGQNAKGNDWLSLGYISGNWAFGTGWSAVGMQAGSYSTGSYWTAVGQYAGGACKGDYWSAVGAASGYGATGDHWSAFGRYAGLGATHTNSVAVGTHAGRNARGNNRMYLDVYGTAPTNYVPDGATNDTIFLNNDGHLYLGGGAARAENPSAGGTLRGPWKTTHTATNSNEIVNYQTMTSMGYLNSISGLNISELNNDEVYLTSYDATFMETVMLAADALPTGGGVMDSGTEFPAAIPAVWWLDAISGGSGSSDSTGWDKLTISMRDGWIRWNEGYDSSIIFTNMMLRGAWRVDSNATESSQIVNYQTMTNQNFAKLNADNLFTGSNSMNTLTITNTTGANVDGTGALVVQGGGYFEDGLVVNYGNGLLIGALGGVCPAAGQFQNRNTSTSVTLCEWTSGYSIEAYGGPGYFDAGLYAKNSDGTLIASFGGVTPAAGYLANSNTGKSVTLCEWASPYAIYTSGGINLDTGDYYHAGVQGVTTNGFSGGILTDFSAFTAAAGIGVVASDIPMGVYTNR